MRTKAALAEYAPNASDIYYVLRQVPPEKQAAYLAVHAFAIELYKISETYRELKIAQQKLAWWNDEIKRLYQGTPSHPITQALNEHIKPYKLQEIEFLALLEGALLSTTTQIFETSHELRQHYQHTGGILAMLKAKILGSDLIINNAEMHKIIHQLGISQEIFRHLLNLPKFLQRQHLYLPISLFQKEQVDPQLILQGKNLSSLIPLLQSELTEAQKILSASLMQLTNEQKKILRPLILEIKLKLKQTQKTANAAWKIFDYRLELSPLVKFLFTEFAA